MPIATRIVALTPTFAVTGALFAPDLANIARLGFKSVLSVRPDGEEPSQLSARETSVLAWRAGLKFRHVPAAKHDLFTDPLVEAFADAIHSLETPILAHCQSGMRAAILWAAATARSQPVDCVLASLRGAGFELEFLRDDLEAQADRKRWITTSPALDCAGASRMVAHSVAA